MQRRVAGSRAVSASSSVRKRCRFQSCLSLRMILADGIFLSLLALSSEEWDSYSDRNLLNCRSRSSLSSSSSRLAILSIIYMPQSNSKILQLLYKNMSLQVLVLIDHSSSTLLHSYKLPHAPHIDQDVQLITRKSKGLRTKVGERQKFSSGGGSWFITKGVDGILYGVCVINNYPERVAFGLIQKVEALIKQKNKSNDFQKTIKKIQKQINSLCDTYKDARVDKVRQAEEAVGQLKSELHKGISKLMDNQQNLQKMGEKTSLMKEYAKGFEKQAIVLEQKAFCHKYKIFFIVGIAIGSVLILSGLICFASSRT